MISGVPGLSRFALTAGEGARTPSINAIAFGQGNHAISTYAAGADFIAAVMARRV